MECQLPGIRVISFLAFIMIKTCLKFICYTILALIALLVVFVGYAFTTPVPEGTIFATLFPVFSLRLPQTLFGGITSGPLTPDVPDDMMPMTRPANEQFVTLAGTNDKMVRFIQVATIVNCPATTNLLLKVGTV